MITPKILYNHTQGNNINVIVSNTSSRLLDHRLESQIDTLWQEQIGKCHEKGEKIWDGISYRINALSKDEEGLHMELGPIRWSKRSPIRLVDEIHQLDEEYWGRGVFVTALICTSDGKYIFGERKKTVIKRTMSTTIGGILSPEEVKVDSFDDFFTMLHKEIHEEIGVTADRIIKENFLGVVYSAKADVGFIFTVTLNLSSNDINTLFQERSDDELALLRFVESESLKTHLMEMGDYWALIPEFIA